MKVSDVLSKLRADIAALECYYHEDDWMEGYDIGLQHALELVDKTLQNCAGE